MVWVIVDRLTKSAHFLVVQMTFTFEEFDRLYILEIVQLYGFGFGFDLHGFGFDQGYLREGGLDMEAEAAFLMSLRQCETSQHSA